MAPTAVDRYLLHAGHSAANPMAAAAAAVNRWTDAQSLHGPCSTTHTTWAASTK